MLDRVLILSLVSALSMPSAWADDEDSEHSAQLLGDAADTMGVMMGFDAQNGWTMAYRSKAGAKQQHLSLPFMKTSHAHYVVAVPEGRAPLIVVLASAERNTVDSRTEVLWLLDVSGKVSKRWTLGELLPAKQLALRDSISHSWWYEALPVLKNKVLTLQTINSSRVVLDLEKKSLKTWPALVP